MKIILKNISRQFAIKNNNVHVLQDISFILAENEFLCILGPSGCGKTTLLRIISGLLKPSSGKISYGSDVSKNPSNISFVFQEHGVFPWMNAIDNICFGLKMLGISRTERYTMAAPLIDRLDLGGFQKYFPHQLSLGMRQRVALARALINQTDVLLMDEPFAALDAQMKLISQGKLIEMCNSYKKQVIYVTHDIDEAVLLADRILLLTRSPSTIKKEIIIQKSKPRSFEDNINDDTLIPVKKLIWEHLKEEINGLKKNENEIL